MARGFNWAEEFPELETHYEYVASLECLLQEDIRKLILKIIKSNPERKKYGFLQKMDTALKCSIGTCLVLSFCERVDSVPNQVVTKWNTFITSDEIEILSTLRKSREIMKSW